MKTMSRPALLLFSCLAKALGAFGLLAFGVEDECGGPPPGRAEDLFRPFEQRGTDRSGLGLGLAIAREASRPTAA